MALSFLIVKAGRAILVGMALSAHSEATSDCGPAAPIHRRGLLPVWMLRSYCDAFPSLLSVPSCLLGTALSPSFHPPKRKTLCSQYDKASTSA